MITLAHFPPKQDLGSSRGSNLVRYELKVNNIYWLGLQKNVVFVSIHKLGLLSWKVFQKNSEGKFKVIPKSYK